MPAAPRETVLCRYRYDPLDRLNDCAPAVEARTQRFYCKSRLATEIQGEVQCSVFQHDDQLLAQIRREDVKADTTLLATDHQRSVLNALDATRLHPFAYTPYGHRPPENGLLSLLGFNGERPDPVTGHYLLGNGYRALNPVLMRFNSPDSWSPFGEGGLNAYAYCGGDPRNKEDRSGHIGIFRKLVDFFTRKNSTPIERITKGAKVKLGKETIVEKTKDSTSPPVKIHKYSSSQIAKLSTELNNRSQDIYDKVVQKIENPAGFSMSTEAAQTIDYADALLSNKQILHSQIKPIRRADHINFLVESIEFHRNVVEARKKTEHLKTIMELRLAAQQNIRR